MEVFLGRVVLPIILGGISTPVAIMLGATAPGFVLFILLTLVWLVIINGGVLILDDDFDW